MHGATLTFPTTDRSAYRSPTERVAAEILLADETTVHGELHLQPNALSALGFETPLQLLNRRERFYAVSIPDGQVVLLPRRLTAMVTCADPGAPSLTERRARERVVSLDVELLGGRRVHGWARWELPIAAERTLDYLNGDGDFFAMANDQHTLLINRAHLRAVYPLDD